MQKILIGVSSCLLGNNVRYNAGNCHKSYITNNYAKYFDYKVVCPEVAAGLGVPRKTMFLVENLEKNILAVKTTKEHKDVTDILQKSCNKLIEGLGQVYGFILKAKSPSCGVDTARVFDEDHKYTGFKADGLFVRALRKYDPLLPIEDDGRLNDKGIREHFLKRVFCYYDLKTNFMATKDIKEMTDYHSKHKILLRMHNNMIKKQLGNMLSNITSKDDLTKVKEEYIKIFMQTISKPVNRGNHYMALQNVLREINKRVSKSQRQYLQEILNKYKNSQVAWDVPVSIIKMYLIDLDLPYLAKQSYLNPYPEDLEYFNSEEI